MKHFGGSTGYGHEEAGGREALDQVFAEIFGAESAIVRSQVLNIFPSTFTRLFHLLSLLASGISLQVVLPSLICLGL